MLVSLLNNFLDLSCGDPVFVEPVALKFNRSRTTELERSARNANHINRIILGGIQRKDELHVGKDDRSRFNCSTSGPCNLPAKIVRRDSDVFEWGLAQERPVRIGSGVSSNINVLSRRGGPC